MDTPPAKPRRRFQFSLRTLLIAVIIYVLLCLLTMKVGGAQLAETYAETYRNIVAFNQWRGDANPDHRFRAVATGERLHVEKVRYGALPHMLNGRAYAPAPGLLVWYWDDPECNNCHPCDIYIWLFGYRITLRKNIEPDSLIIEPVTIT